VTDDTLRRPPMPDDVRLAEPATSSSPLRSAYRRLIHRLLDWWLGPLQRSTEDRLYEQAAALHRVSVSLDERVRRLESVGAAVRLARLETATERRPLANEPAPSVVPPLPQHTFALRFRGDVEALAERARWYLTQLPSDGPVIDLGCGRGAVLDAGRAAGRSARGVDLDPDAVDHCRRAGFDVERNDAVVALAAVTPGTLAGIVASHLLEHLPPARVLELLRLAATRLAPTGRLVVEVPNPATFAGLASYFVDPTHERPLHPETLTFLLELAGFGDLRVHLLDPVPAEGRLSEVAAPQERSEADRWTRVMRNFAVLDATVFGHRSYAVVATPAPESPA